MDQWWTYICPMPNRAEIARTGAKDLDPAKKVDQLPSKNPQDTASLMTASQLTKQDTQNGDTTTLPHDDTDLSLTRNTPGVDRHTMAQYLHDYRHGGRERRKRELAQEAAKGETPVHDYAIREIRTDFKSLDHSTGIEATSDTKQTRETSGAGLLPPKMKRLRESIGELPQALHDSEDSTLYPDFLPCDEASNFPMTEVFKYRGNDTGYYRSSGTGGKGAQAVSHAMLWFEDVPPDVENSLVGWPRLGCDKANAQEKCVRVSYRLDTQHPTIVIKVNRAEGENIVMQIFGNSLDRNEDGSAIGLQFTGGSRAAIDQSTLPTSDADVKELYESGHLWRTQVKLYLDDQEPTFGAIGGPVWHGISAEEIRRIKASRFTQDTPYWERVVARLAKSRRFSILRHRPADWEVTEAFAEYFTSCMYATAQYGNWWWYKLATGYYPSDPEFPADPPIPRWLIKEVKVKYEDRVPVSYEPATTAAFQRQNAEVDPESEVGRSLDYSVAASHDTPGCNVFYKHKQKEDKRSGKPVIEWKFQKSEQSRAPKKGWKPTRRAGELAGLRAAGSG